MNRRDVLKAAAALAAGQFPFGWSARAADPDKKRNLLVYTRSEGYQHDVVKIDPKTKTCLVDQILTDMGKANGFDVTCTKDGRVFLPETLAKFDAIFFETQGDLLAEKCQDGSPPMTVEGKKALLNFVASGKGFVGSHCASDTFHSPGHANGDFKEQEKRDPYIEMLGGEFIRHGEQQDGWMRLADPKFPGTKGLQDFKIKEEWYSLKHFAPDLHVILVQDTKGMRNLDYQRPNFPATWARKHEKGRVFYTSMGHRKEVWKLETFQQLLLGGLQWAFGDVEADLTPNLKDAAPQASELPKEKK
jgi:type 1 glutamine amidotransferase